MVFTSCGNGSVSQACYGSPRLASTYAEDTSGKRRGNFIVERMSCQHLAVGLNIYLDLLFLAEWFQESIHRCNICEKQTICSRLRPKSVLSIHGRPQHNFCSPVGWAHSLSWSSPADCSITLSHFVINRMLKCEPYLKKYGHLFNVLIAISGVHFSVETEEIKQRAGFSGQVQRQWTWPVSCQSPRWL